MTSLLMALILGSGSQQVSAKGHHPRVDQRWYFGAAMNYNLPTGQLYYPVKFNPVFSSTSTMVGGGFSYTPSFSYALRIGYDRSFTKNGVHGFTAGIGFTDRKKVLHYHDYNFVLNGITYSKHIDRYVFDFLDFELRLAYRFSMNRTMIQFGALGLIRTQNISRIYEIDGHHSRITSSYWYKLMRWYPVVQLNYRFLAQGKLQIEAFIGGNCRMIPEETAVWWDIQAGVGVSLVKRIKRKR
ncbi:MAG: hypothetical protein JSS84_12150 [Bacteroidetes bacterium]|nr:hypothetical protein [Bacteroidota bacterium]